MNQIIIEKKTYEKITQWIIEMRKYPNHETFAIGIDKMAHCNIVKYDLFIKVHLTSSAFKLEMVKE